MRSVRFLVMCFGVAATAFGRLGDTLDQAEARYGLEKTKPLPGGAAKLLEGSREVFFEFEGWRIRCAMLQATDGQFYVVREEYMKIWNSDVMKAGGVIQIRDFERDAVFRAEGGEWSSKALAEPGRDLISSAANQYVRMMGLTKAWVRSDGGMARMNRGDLNIILDLPQARKYEAQLKGISDQQQRQQAQRLFQQPQPVQTPLPNPVLTKPSLQSGSPPKQLPPRAATPKLASPTVLPATPSPGLPGVSGFVVVVGLGGLAGLARVVFSRRSKPSGPHPQTEPPPIPASVPPPIPTSGLQGRTVKDLTWDEFELLVGEIYRRKGFTVELSAGTGADGGVDLVLHHDDQRVLVQCKSWNVYKVAAPAIREFYGVLVSEKAERGIFITTGQYTRDAEEFAEGKPMDMIDGSTFQALLQGASSDPNDDLLNVALWAPVFLAAAKVTIPPCPFCKVTMVKRQGRTGAFFGCPTYPRCRGKREIRKHIVL